MKPETIVLHTSLALKKEEKCLIITDKGLQAMGKKMFDEASKTATSEIIEIPVAKVNGEEPPRWAEEKMLDADVIVMMTSKSLSWTEARAKASANGARIVSMPGITEDIMYRAIDVDYDKMKEETSWLAGLMDDARSVRITTELGTDIRMSIDGRKAHGRDAGIYDKPGKWGNLPCGEAFIAPVEGSAAGVYIVDASQAGVGKLQEPIRITVEDGYAVCFEGGRQSEEFLDMVKSIGNKAAYNIAELGIGTNPKARVIGKVLEDEKVKGTCHIALGKNSGFGGKTDVPFHVDGIISMPTIYLDGRKIMEKGVVNRRW